MSRNRQDNAPPLLKPAQERKEKTDNGKNFLDRVALYLSQIEFGEVIVTVHNKKIVQIEKREKTRFQD